MPDTHKWERATEAELAQGTLCWYLARNTVFHDGQEWESWQPCPVTGTQLLRRLERGGDILEWLKDYVGKD